jgi:rhodanese-related sulfurtransferase
MKKGYKQLVEEANAVVETVSPAEAARRAKQADAVLVDLRDPRELEREGRIPDAFHAPRGMLEFWIDPESPYHKDIFASGRHLVFFCGGGWRSALAAKTAQEMGLDNVSHIDGGFGAWRKEGLPVEGGKKD